MNVEPVSAETLQRWFQWMPNYEIALNEELDKIAVECSGFDTSGPPCTGCPCDERCPVLNRRIRLNSLHERKGKQVISCH